MTSVLIIGGTRFIGRHLVEEFLDHDYAVTLFNRGRHENPFADRDGVTQFTGDRTSSAALKQANDSIDPDVVVDCVAYFPGEVEMTTKIFSDVDGYVFISSGAAYGPDTIPKREDETPLEPCTDEQAVDDSSETYGARKAEGDRIVFEAASNGVRAMSVRPTIVYGPYDYTGRFQYWIDRIRQHDEVLVPGDGTNIHHLVSVYNTVRSIRTVAENGTAGEAYNAGDRTVLRIGSLLETIASTLDAGTEFVHVNDRELAAGDLSMTDFPLYNPDVHILSTEKLHNIGWEPVAAETAIERTVEAATAPERDPGPKREAEKEVLDSGRFST